ncbi:MAG: hypothetical protein ACRDSZ_17020 [Pseudonocardiaceae bacterium]
MTWPPPSDPAKPGVDILNAYLRELTQEEMDHDREGFLHAVSGCHPNELLVCLGTGPSLAAAPLELMSGVTTLGCNGIGHVYQPSYYVIADPFIYGLHQDVFLACPGTRILSSFTHGEYDLRLYYRREDVIGLTRDRVFSADSTGFLLISIACIMGASRILLAGYDGYAPGSQRYHCYDEAEVEAHRVRYEWQPGSTKEDLLRRAFSNAAQVAPKLGLDISLITPSPFLGDLFSYVEPERALGHG